MAKKKKKSTQPQSYIVQDPFTGQKYKTTNAQAAQNMRKTYASQAANPITKTIRVNYTDMGRGGFGGELDRIGNFAGSLGAGIGALFGGGDTEKAMQDYRFNANPKQVRGLEMTPEEFEQFVAQNPNFQIDAENLFTREKYGQQGKKASMGWLDDLAGSIVSPFPSLLETSGELGANIGRDLRHLGQPQPEGVANFGGLWDTRPQKSPLFMSDERYQDFSEAPVLRLAQDLAGVGSFMVPGGSGIKGLAATGALAGGLSGLGQTSTKDLMAGDFSKTLMGAGAGGIAGAGIGAISKGLGKFGGKIAAKSASKGDDFADILNAPGLTQQSGLGAGSSKPFNQYLNNLSAQQGSMSPKAFKNAMQKFVDRANDAAKQGVADASDVVGAIKSLYGVTPKGARIGVKVTERFNPTDDIGINAKKLGEVTSRPRPELNSLKKAGMMDEYSRLGFTTRSGAVDFAGGKLDDITTIERARQFYDLPRDADGISELFVKVGEARGSILENSGKLIEKNVDEIASPAVGRSISLRTNRQLSPVDAQAAIKDRMLDIAEEMGMKRPIGLDGVKINAPDLQRLKDATSAGYVSTLSKKATKDAGDWVDAAIHKWAKSELTKIPGYKATNKIHEVLYTQNPGLRRAYDTGMLGTGSASVLKGPRGILDEASQFVAKNVGKGKEFIGDMIDRNGGQLRIPGSSIVEKGVQSTGNNIGRVGQILGSQPIRRAGPLLAANAITQDSQQNTLPSEIPQTMRGGYQFPGDTLNTTIAASENNGSTVQAEPSFDYDSLAMDMLKMGYSPSEVQDELKAVRAIFGGGQETMFAGMLTDQSDPRSQLSAQLLDQGYDPSQVKTIVDLMMGGEQKTTADQRKAAYDLENATHYLGLLEETVDKYSNRFNPVLGQDIFGGIGQFVDPERSRADTTIKSLVQTIAKSLEGGRLTDADREYYKQFTPSLTDTPDAARNKVLGLLDILRERQGAFNAVYQ